MIFVGASMAKENLSDRVWNALQNFSLVIIQKVEPERANPVYNVYACIGKLDAGQIKED